MAAALGRTSAVALRPPPPMMSAPPPFPPPPPAELPKILNLGTMRDPPLPLFLLPLMATADLALRTTLDVAFSGLGDGGCGL